MPTDCCTKLSKILKTDLFDIKTSKPPSYLSCFGISNKSILIIHKWDKPQETFRQVEKFNSVINNTEFELSGQPLECPFTEGTTLDDTVLEKQVSKNEEDFHAPLSVLEARHCLGLSNLYVKPQIPTWVLVDSEGKDNTVLLGSHITNGWCFRSWVEIQGMHAITDNIQSMISDHKKIAMLPDVQMKSEVISYFNAYDIDNTIGSSVAENVTLEVTWRNPSYDVPIDEADTTVIVTTVVGSKDNVTSPIWQQVLLLNMYLNTISKFKSEQSQQVPYQRDSIQIPSSRDVFPKSEETTTGNLRDKVLCLIKVPDHVSLNRDFSRSKAETSRKIKELVEDVISGNRPGQDFTDKLWTLLIGANTYQELSSCMQLVFQEVKRQSIKPYIMTKNKTRLAQALRNANSNINSQLMYEPLELLLELGLEKLKNDYLYIFNLSQLANSDLLVVPVPPCSDWDLEVKTRLNWFARVHAVLDSVYLTEEKLGSDLDTLTSVNSTALKTYFGNNSPVSCIQDIIDNPIYEIKAAVKSRNVNCHIGSGRQFHKWLLKLTSVAASRTVSSSYLVTLNLPFPESIKKKVFEEDCSEDTGFLEETVLVCDMQSMYYSAKLVTVGDKFL